MGHDWVIEVLQDLADYAERNGLPRLARKAAETLLVAQQEIGEAAEDDPPEDSGGMTPVH
ncbi:hypothetical protein C0V75_12235 [Tabrizicola sp. TH137]|nr:hypothetical protein C0V75_12235 [Tabrizicola sp. TH137]